MTRLPVPRLLRTAMLLTVGLAAFAAPAGAQTSPAGQSPMPQPRSAFTADQRAEIVRIVRDALKQDPSILRDAVAALQADEADQQAAASRTAIAAHRADLANPADPAIGNPKGDVTIVEFFDTRCPYCRHMEPTMSQFLHDDRGVKLVFKDLPILGPASVLGSKALLAAQRQGGYAKLRAAIMQAAPDLTMDSLQPLATGAGLDWARLQADMADPAIEKRLDANVKLAHDLGIDGTPVLVIGDAMVPGAVDMPDLARAVGVARGTARN